jgi:MFS family permease
MAVDQALITQVLPDAESRAQDLGIMNIGTVVPPALAPLIASFVITSDRGYPLLFSCVGVAATVGVVLVYRVRSVR